MASSAIQNKPQAAAPAAGFGWVLQRLAEGSSAAKQVFQTIWQIQQMWDCDTVLNTDRAKPEPLWNIASAAQQLAGTTALVMQQAQACRHASSEDADMSPSHAMRFLAPGCTTALGAIQATQGSGGVGLLPLAHPAWWHGAVACALAGYPLLQVVASQTTGSPAGLDTASPSLTAAEVWASRAAVFHNAQWQPARAASTPSTTRAGAGVSDELERPAQAPIQYWGDGPACLPSGTCIPAPRMFILHSVGPRHTHNITILASFALQQLASGALRSVQDSDPVAAGAAAEFPSIESAWLALLYSSVAPLIVQQWGCLTAAKPHANVHVQGRVLLGVRQGENHWGTCRSALSPAYDMGHALGWRDPACPLLLQQQQPGSALQLRSTKVAHALTGLQADRPADAQANALDEVLHTMSASSERAVAARDHMQAWWLAAADAAMSADVASALAKAVTMSDLGYQAAHYRESHAAVSIPPLLHTAASGMEPSVSSPAPAAMLESRISMAAPSPVASRTTDIVLEDVPVQDPDPVQETVAQLPPTVVCQVSPRRLAEQVSPDNIPPALDMAAITPLSALRARAGQGRQQIDASVASRAPWVGRSPDCTFVQLSPTPAPSARDIPALSSADLARADAARQAQARLMARFGGYRSPPASSSAHGQAASSLAKAQVPARPGTQQEATASPSAQARADRPASHEEEPASVEDSPDQTLAGPARPRPAGMSPA